MKSATARSQRSSLAAQAFASLGLAAPGAGGMNANAAPAESAPPLYPSVIIGSVFINLLALGLPLVVLQVYDRVLPNKAVETLTLLLLGLAVVLLLDLAMKLSRAYLVGWAAARYQHRMGIAAITRLLEAPAALVEKDPPSVHADRLNALDALRDFYGGQSRLLLLDLPFVIVFAGLIAFVGGFLVLVPVVLFLVFGALTLAAGRQVRAVMDERSLFDDRKYDFIVEALAGIQTIKGLAMEPQIMRRFERLQRAGADAAYRTIILTNAAQSHGSLFANLTMIAVVAFGAIMVIGGDLTIGALACCTLLSGRTIQPLLKGLGLWAQLQSLSVARRRVRELFALPVRAPAAPPAAIECQGAISLRDVSFSYADGGSPTIDRVDLEIAAGEIIGIRGDDGSGKSTLVRLMAGQFPPGTGSVSVDGHDLSGDGVDALKDEIAYVPQDCAMFQGTILQNLAMFRTGDAIDAAREAAQMIGLEEDIHRLPEGYDTTLSEGIAEELPGGIMQRIVIARALARRPKILLFDEANRQLDSRGDRLLREGIETLRGRATIVLVTLRPSLLRLADRTFEMTDGRICPVDDGALSSRQAAAGPRVPA